VEGILEPGLLVLLAERPGYGYDLAPRLTERSFIPAILPRARVYEALQRLEGDGAVESRRQKSAEGPDRHTYAITRGGRVRLDRWLEALRPTERSLRLLRQAYERLPKGGDEMGCCCGQRDDAQHDAAGRDDPVEERVARLEAELADLRASAGR
jgi:PadR family transcriptional regulator PadR